jgi:hypothetical protein
MSYDDEDGVYQSASNREHEQGRRRRLAVAGVVALAAVLGGGAYLITDRVTRQPGTEAEQPLEPAVVPASEPAPSEPGETTGTPSPKPTISTKNAVKQSYTASPVPTPSGSMSVDEQIRVAQEAAAREGHPVAPALTTAPGLHAADAVRERNENRPNGSLRVVSARSDLTGQREMLWAADHGKRYGDVTCTQNFHFSNNTTPKVRPNMLLCWRTSDRKSVLTVLIDRGGHPSTAESIETIDREWATLG